jgi:hypothetical protein
MSEQYASYVPGQESAPAEDQAGVESDRAGNNNKPNKKPQKVDNSIGGTSDASLKKEFGKSRKYDDIEYSNLHCQLIVNFDLFMLLAMIDIDNNKYIDKNDLKKMFGKFVPESMINKAIGLIDKNKDGKISFEEYKSIRTTIGAVKLPSSFGKKY